MEKVENGLFVSVEYTGTLDNGEVFDSSQGREPLEVEMGAGKMIKGFEAALEGMSLNEEKTFTLPPEEAYGNKDENRVHSFARSEIPPNIDPQVGQTLILTTPEGHQIPAQIAKVDDSQVTLDLNHPLAGEALTFEIKIVGISDAPTQMAAGCNCDSGCDSADGGGCGSGCC